MTQTPSFWSWVCSIALHGLVLIFVFSEPSLTMEQARDDDDSVEVKLLPANVIVEAQSLPQRADHSLPVEATAPTQKTAFDSKADTAEAASRKAARQYASNSTPPIAEPLQNEGKAELALSSKAPEDDIPGIIDADGDHAPAMQVPELAQWTVTRRLIQTGYITVHINLNSHGSVVWFRNSLFEAREIASRGVQASQRGWEVKKTNDLSQLRRQIINEIAPQAERRHIDRRYLESSQIQLRPSVAFDNRLLIKQARFAQSQGCKLEELRSTRFKKVESSGHIDFRIVGAEKIDTASNNCLRAGSYGE